MEVKDIQGNILIDALVTEQAVKVDELMKQHSITLSWVSVTDDELPLGAYIEYEGVRYSLLAPYKPEQSDEATYAYKPVFEHPIMRWQYIPFFFYTYSEGKVVSKELDWNLTDNPANFMKAVCDAILNETGEDWSYEISADLSASASQSFSNTDIFSALNAIAGAFETEWWFDYANKIVYLSKASFGSAVTLEVGQNIGVPSKNQSKDGYYTRFYAFGSTRNIEQNYAGSNVNSIVNKRLTLNPAKYPNGYIDIRGGLTESEILVKTLVFDDIYPSSSLTIADVKVRLMWRLDSDKKKVQIGTDSNGNPVYDQYAIWYFKVPELQFDKDSIISGKPLSVHFNSGALNGREFELTYHDTEEDVETSDGTSIHVEKGDFEINFIEEGTFIIPAISGLVPNDGDEITLFNIKMPEEYKTSAYNDLEEAVLKEIAKQDVDNNNYTFESNKEAFYESNPNLTVGRKVLYKNGNSVLETRVIKLETQLDYAFEQKITIGNEQIKGNTQTLKEEVVNANQNIDLISAINESTQQLVQSYQRTQKALLDSMAKWGDMWSLDAIKGIVRTRYNIVSEQEVISNRRATGAGSGTGSGYGRLDNWAEWDAETMLTYVLSAKLGVSLNERLKYVEQNGSGLNEDDLERYLNDNKYLQEGDIAELKATVDGLDDLLNGGTKEVIDTWNEVVSFLDGYSQSDDLAAILSGMNTDIANRVLIEDFEKLEEAVLAIDISGLSKRLDVAEQAIKTNATAIATNATNITNLNNRVKTLEDLGLTLEGDAETGYYIKSAYSFVSQGEIISGRRASGSGSGGGGGISEITAQMVVDALGYVPYSSLNPAGYITSSALNGYAKLADIPTSLPASDVYDWAKAATKPSYTASEVGALSTSGGTIAGAPAQITLRANTASSDSWVQFTDAETNDIYAVGLRRPADMYGLQYRINSDYYSIYHEGNFNPNNYLAKSGGFISSSGWRNQLNILRAEAGDSVIGFFNQNTDNYLGAIGFDNDTNLIVNVKNVGNANILHSSNYSSYALPLDGGTMKGNFTMSYNGSTGDYLSYGIYFQDYIYSAFLYTANGTLYYDATYNAKSRVVILSDNIKDYNAGSATKLQTGRYLWGNYFNGEQNISSALFLNSGGDGIYVDYNGINYHNSNNGWIATNINFQSNGGLWLSPYAGNVLIGTTTDNSSGAKLQVNGGATFAADVNIYDMNGVKTRLTQYTYDNIGRIYVYNETAAAYSDMRIGRDTTEGIVIQSNGNVLIGNPNDNGTKFQVNGAISATYSQFSHTTPIRFTATGTGTYNIATIESNSSGFIIERARKTDSGSGAIIPFIISQRGGGVAAKFEGDNLIVSGEVISSRRASSSDARLKDNINRLIAEDCLAMVRNLQPSSWDWKENGEHSMGFIAQDVEQYMPYAVTKIKDDVLGQRLNLQYDQFFAPVVGAIQCLDVKVNSHEDEIETLKKRVKYLENKLQEYGYNRY